MSLRKSPALTPALLAACRRNAQKSTGPRTARGKARVRMNALREGGRSQLFRDFLLAVLESPPGGIKAVVRNMLTWDLARQPVFLCWAEMGLQSELPDQERRRWVRWLLRRNRKKQHYFFDQSGNLIDNKASSKTKKTFCVDVVEK